MAVDLVGFGIVLPILPIYARRFHASSLAAALLVSAFSAAGFVTAPLWGRFSDRYGRRPVILISLAGTALGSLLTGAATGLVLLFVGRVIDGASGASISVAQAAAADMVPAEERSRLFGLLGAAFGIGFVAGPAIGALGALWGPRVPFFLAATLSAANTVVAWRRLPETHPRVPAAHPPEPTSRVGSSDPRPGPGGGAPGAAAGPDAPAGSEGRAGPGAAGGPGPAWRSPVLRSALPLLVVAFSAMVAFSGFEATFALFGQRHLGLGIGSAAAVFVAVGAVIVAVQGGLVHEVSRRLGETTTLVLGLVLDTTGLVVLAPARSWALAAPALLLLTVGQGLLQTTMASALAGRAGPARRGQVLGAQQSVSALARILGPAAGGALLGSSGSGVTYLFGAALSLFALLVIFWDRRR
ncbi:MAG: MFS transporter [Acidobacteriota bacterium]|nr:MFS transporter [Acidobacteriota bacterium]